ncbi:MAG TPA: hypothetical protein VHZ95_10250, partial [Polyangiales bacterium]|nr:hypothetical protein [Polyangiales bacterium]
IALGSERDPALLHGQAAMLATLTSVACAGMGPELLHDQLVRLGASLEPRVDPESYGLLMRVPKAHWQDGLDLALRCARTPSHQATLFSDAAIQLLSRMHAQGGALSYRARASALIAPRAPGVFAPWGDPTRLGNLNTRNLESAEREIQAATRWAIGIVGPVSVADAVERTARRLADLEPGSMPKPIVSDALGPQPEIPHALNPSGVNVVAVWSARGKFGHALGARVFARALGTLLGAVEGIELLWHDGDVHGDLAFAAIALHVQPNLAGALPKLLAAAADSFDERVIDRSLEPAIAQARDAQNAADAQIAVRAERIARIRLGAPLGEPSADDAMLVMRALRGAVARWAVVP